MRLEGDACSLRIVNDVSYVMRINHESFCVAGAVFGEVGGVMPVAPRIVNDVSYAEQWINHVVHFAWQAQYLVRLEK